MTMRRLITCAVGLVSAAALCACGSSAGSGGGSGANAPYRVLALIALSGPFALDGKAEAVGVRAAVTVVNQHGGILGHPVALTVVNDNGDATTALTDVWVAVRASLRAVLEKVTLADLAAGKLPSSVTRLTKDPDTWEPH